MEQMNDLVWSNERRRLGDLVPWPRNPRQIKRGLSARDRTPRRGDVFETLQRYFVDHVVTTDFDAHPLPPQVITNSGRCFAKDICRRADGDKLSVVDSQLTSRSCLHVELA